MTKNERDKLMELLKRFSQEYCCDDMEVTEESYCKDCLLYQKECCQMINIISEYLNDEVKEEHMIRGINFEYNRRKED